jgi:NADH:ubiquinone reductase (non-electrogenic)
MYNHLHPQAQKPMDPNKKTVVILGSGWASTSLLKAINTDIYNVVVVSPRNYFLFTPLLPSCTVGTIDIRSLVEPIRFITRHKSTDIKVYEAECIDIDAENKLITIIGKSIREGKIIGKSSNMYLKT